VKKNRTGQSEVMGRIISEGAVEQNRVDYSRIRPDEEEC
jgi:hypothetical protein